MIYFIHARMDGYRPSFDGAMFYNGALWTSTWREAATQEEAEAEFREELDEVGFYPDVLVTHRTFATPDERDDYVEECQASIQANDALGNDKVIPFPNPMFGWHDDPEWMGVPREEMERDWRESANAVNPWIDSGKRHDDAGQVVGMKFKKAKDLDRQPTHRKKSAPVTEEGVAACPVNHDIIPYCGCGYAKLKMEKFREGIAEAEAAKVQAGEQQEHQGALF